MLAPKRIKHRKQHRGRMRGLAKGHTDIQSGDYAIVAMEPGWITNRPGPQPVPAAGSPGQGPKRPRVASGSPERSTLQR